MKYLYTSIVALLAVAIVVGAATYIHKHNSNVAASAAEQTKQKKTAHHTASSQTKSDTTKKKSTKKTIDWNAPSGGPIQHYLQMRNYGLMFRSMIKKCI